MIISLNNADWHLTGVWPWAPVLGKSLETGNVLRGITQRIPASVPGSVYADLLKSKMIEDPYIGLNSLNCEWVESKWWNYDTVFETPERKLNEQIFLCFRGLDYRARIVLNQEEIYIHEGMFLPLELDVTDFLKEKVNTLNVLFEECPREMGLGITSKVHTQKARFGYKWDFGTRLVNVGIWDDVYLKKTGAARLHNLWARTDWHNGIGEIVIKARIEGSGQAKICLYSPDGTLLCKQTLNAKGKISVCLKVNDPSLWYPYQLGEQPLYRIAIWLFTGDILSDEESFLTGIRSLSFMKNENAPEDSFPYTIVVNGQKVYIKGVNLTPFDHMYGCVTNEKYADYITLLKNCNINLVRIWGGGLIEKEIFYRLCDKNGILVWQEFIQSSSGVENVPPTGKEFLQILEKNAIQAVTEKRKHVSLVIWCGGNELRERPNDDTPVTTTNLNIALLQRVVVEQDSQRLFLPSSASGPYEFVTSHGGHDVHGLWRYDGLISHYSLYNNADNLLHSEFGVDGMSSVASVRYITGQKNPPIEDSESNLVWRFHGEWWDNLAQNQELFGKFSFLEQFVVCSQLMQGEGIRYIVESNRRRAFHNSGSIVWQFNEPWPNVSCTNLVEYFMRPKGGYYFLKRAYAPADLSMRYDTINPKLGSTYEYQILLSAFENETYTAGYEILSSAGVCITAENSTIIVQYGTVVQMFSLQLSTPRTKDSLFFIRLYLQKDGMRCYENTYFFSSAKKTPFAPLLSCPCSLQWEKKDNNYTVTNSGAGVAIYVHPVSNGCPVFDESWVCVFPGERRSFVLISGDCDDIQFQCVNQIYYST